MDFVTRHIGSDGNLRHQLLIQSSDAISHLPFKLLYDEAKTEAGKQLTKEQWDQIAPELIKLMGLQPGDNPIEILRVPAIAKN